jgi:uncharacterized membrane protein YhaH (DUF805 family)
VQAVSITMNDFLVDINYIHLSIPIWNGLPHLRDSEFDKAATLDRNWLFGLGGRVNRRTYLIQELIGLGAGAAGFGIVFAFGSAIALAVFWAFFLTGFAIHISASVRRLHDAGISGWAVLAIWIPMIGQVIWALMFIVPGNAQPNKHGTTPSAFDLG